MMDNVTWKSSWTDPGATAIDAVDGNVSASIQSFGAGAVDTSTPTAPGKDFGFVVEYYVEDKSKNAAPIARRLVRVVCPGTEAYCINPDTNAATCTVKGVCGASQLLSVSASSSTPSASSSSSKTKAAPSAPPTPPSIRLVVPGTALIKAGDVYDRCADDAPCQLYVSEEWQLKMPRMATWTGKYWSVEAGRKGSTTDHSVLLAMLAKVFTESRSRQPLICY